MNLIFRGCHVAATHADFYHGAHDFADRTLCGLPVKGMKEVANYGRMEFCHACTKTLSKEAQ